ncbi:hypothetical protein D3875_18490 [Deinococcus cavernae]|uniref:YoaR-like putative peptidoglycan binding domain-containing protein n=1 Tax=Deinococcus cavernae TaxID=2320857 RepID=A0A418VAW2_9DEIO|nr:VanW family protein [Deinococcus cavernae]RJF73243.1 hypothetical protein D3875_18490 [Deinococcus cavernae]
MTVGTKYAIGGVITALLLGGALAMGVATQDTGTLAPGVRVGGVDVGGLTPDAAAQRLRDAAGKGRPVTVKAADQTWTLTSTALGWQIDPRASLRPAQAYTQERSMLERLQGALGRAEPQSFPLITSVDTGKTAATLSKLTAPLGTQPRPATLGFDKKTLKYAVLTPDTPGRQADVESAVNTFKANPDVSTLTLPLITWKSPQSAENLQKLADQGNRLMRRMVFKLEGTTRTGVLSPLQVADLYWVKPEGIVLDPATIDRAFKFVSGYINEPARDARYAWQGGKYVRVAEKTGHEVDRAAALDVFKKALVDPNARAVVFPAKVAQPKLTAAQLPDPNKLQLIAVGRSTYYHSSPERRTNVANAAQKIDGVVVPAGEVFSFLNALGGITPDNGFVGGLIISGGRTVDGLGGGVCQVSTTTFRALYQAGLPVVERNQHSYRVGYYEPQVGFEAAVYDPGVDLKLKNDTGGTVMLKTQNNNKTSTLVVEVWGTVKPQRSVSVSPAVILSRQAHPPAKYVYNPALGGRVAQVDWAQDGYNLYITRAIKDASGAVKYDRTTTNYKPWQAVYEYGPGTALANSGRPRS